MRNLNKAFTHMPTALKGLRDLPFSTIVALVLCAVFATLGIYTAYSVNPDIPMSSSGKVAPAIDDGVHAILLARQGHPFVELA